jgi:ADP-ribose pyrophosphatase YjhB (NUDIX family)
MKQLRPVARVVVIQDNKLLLVRNNGGSFWYPPGGGWEYEYETLIDCAKREVKEETSYDVMIRRMLWLSEFRETEKVYLESFWLGALASDEDLEAHARHIDQDPNGAVVEVRWFTEAELAGLTVFPERLKNFSQVSPIGDDPYIV